MEQSFKKTMEEIEQNQEIEPFMSINDVIAEGSLEFNFDL